MKNKKNKIYEMKYYILYNYKSALETIVSNFSYSSMITPSPLLRVYIYQNIYFILSFRGIGPTSLILLHFQC